MTTEELSTWVNFYNWEADEQKKSLAKAKAKAKAKGRRGGSGNRMTLGSGSKGPASRG